VGEYDCIVDNLHARAYQEYQKVRTYTKRKGDGGAFNPKSPENRAPICDFGQPHYQHYVYNERGRKTRDERKQPNKKEGFTVRARADGDRRINENIDGGDDAGGAEGEGSSPTQ